VKNKVRRRMEGVADYKRDKDTHQMITLLKLLEKGVFYMI
jgi:hypothetical protein